MSSLVLGCDQPADSGHHEPQVVQGEVQGVSSQQESRATGYLVTPSYTLASLKFLSLTEI